MKNVLLSPDEPAGPIAKGRIPLNPIDIFLLTWGFGFAPLTRPARNYQGKFCLDNR